MVMDKEWEKFHGGPTAPRDKRMHAAVTRQGQIVINENIFRLIGKPDAVYIYFNRARKQIALESTSARFSEAFPVKPMKTSGYRIQAAPFMRHHGIRITERLKFARPDLGPGGHPGRVMAEALRDGGPPPEAKKVILRSEPAANGFLTVLNRQDAAGHRRNECGPPCRAWT